MRRLATVAPLRLALTRPLVPLRINGLRLQSGHGATRRAPRNRPPVRPLSITNRTAQASSLVQSFIKSVRTAPTATSDSSVPTEAVILDYTILCLEAEMLLENNEGNNFALACAVQGLIAKAKAWKNSEIESAVEALEGASGNIPDNWQVTIKFGVITRH